MRSALSRRKKFVFPLPVLEVATYNIPCEKQCFLASTPTHKNVCPCDLFTVIAKQSFIGNCNRLNSNGNSVDDGIRGILGINRRSPLYGPHEIIASITLPSNWVMIHRVPFIALGGSKFRKMIIGAPIFYFLL